MKILMVCELKNIVEVLDTEFVPRTGDIVDMYYQPLPTVKKVITFPSDARLRLLGIDSPENICAVVMVE